MSLETLENFRWLLHYAAAQYYHIIYINHTSIQLDLQSVITYIAITTCKNKGPIPPLKIYIMYLCRGVFRIL